MMYTQAPVLFQRTKKLGFYVPYGPLDVRYRCPFIQRNSFSWHNPLAGPLAQKCNGGTSMAFLQICRRHQILFEGASASVKLLLTRKGFQSCRILHSHESKHLRVGKKDYSFPCVYKIRTRRPGNVFSFNQGQPGNKDN